MNHKCKAIKSIKKQNVKINKIFYGSQNKTNIKLEQSMESEISFKKV